MTTAERDDYIVEHYGSTPRVQLAEAVAMTLPSLDTRVWQLRKKGRIAPKASKGQLTVEETAVEPKHKCPPHHWLEGDEAILRELPNFYKDHPEPMVGEMYRVCLYCLEVEPISNGLKSDTKVAQVVAEELRKRRRDLVEEYGLGRWNSHRVPIKQRIAEIPEGHRIPTNIPAQVPAPPPGSHYVDVEGVRLLVSDTPEVEDEVPTGLDPEDALRAFEQIVAETPEGHHFPSNIPARFPDHISGDGSGTWVDEGIKVVLPVHYDGDSGDEHHPRPEPLHHVDIPEEPGAPLLPAESETDFRELYQKLYVENIELRTELRDARRKLTRYLLLEKRKAIRKNLKVLNEELRELEAEIEGEIEAA